MAGNRREHSAFLSGERDWSKLQAPYFIRKLYAAIYFCMLSVVAKADHPAMCLSL
jgi:hypothetical protein